MSTLADSLNLRPQEKRIIAVIAVVVFVVLNLVLVFPHFKDYRIIQAQLKKTQLNIITNRLVIALDKKESGGLKEQLRLLQTGKGGPVGDKEIQLQQTITDQARVSGVFIQNISGVSSTPIGPGSMSDKFFESESIRIVVQSGEDSLVKFLYNVGNDPAMIRVRELEMHPLDNNRYKLNAAITLTADYQKTVAPKKAAPIITDTTLKPPAKRATPASPPPAARAASTNANPAPATSAPTPPGPVRAPTQLVPGHALSPSAPGPTNLPPVPPRPPRTP